MCMLQVQVQLQVQVHVHTFTLLAVRRAIPSQAPLTSPPPTSLSRSTSSQKIPQRVRIRGRSAGTWSVAAESSVPLHSWI